ncbi:MAG: polysaccharide pyruvyl transferase family protein, partial [Muribaculaceae bacterium]
ISEVEIPGVALAARLASQISTYHTAQMKIGIITQPLRNNYGGLLQNFALQSALRTMGHTPVTFDHCWVPDTLKGKLYYRIKFLTERKSGYETLLSIWPAIHSFKQRHIKYDLDFATETGYRRLERRHKIDMLLLGSDQVWRPIYVMNMAMDFGAYASVPIVTYAASLGVDNWEFTPRMTADARRWARRIKAVSVREASAIPLLREHLGITDITHVLDPTMLLTAAHYRELYSRSNDEAPRPKHLFTYILDASPAADAIVADISKKTCLSVMGATVVEKCDSATPPPLSPEQWLQGIDDAAVVVCDSYHGAVFSIIYHRPFWVLPNKTRGNTRLMGLLNMFGLEDRLLTSAQEPAGGWLRPIDWAPVNERMRHWRSLSYDYLNGAIQCIANRRAD